METKELIEKINDFGVKKSVRKYNDFQKKKNEVEEYSCIIKRYIGKMRELYCVALAIFDNGIENSFLYTDGVSHGLGFFREYKGSTSVYYPKKKFGIEGGGSCGSDLYVDLDNGEIIYEGEYGDYHHLYYLKKLAQTFNEWKGKTICIIENIIS